MLYDVVPATSLRCSEAIMNGLMSVLKITQTIFDVVIHVVDRTLRAIKKFVWKTLVFTEKHETRRFAGSKMNH